MAANGNTFGLALSCTHAQSFPKILVPVFFSFVDRHRFDADPDSDLIFHFDAVPYPDPIPSFTHVGRSEDQKFLI